MNFDIEKCRCNQCGNDLSNTDSWYDGSKLYCDELCYMKNKGIKLVTVQAVQYDKNKRKREYIEKLHKNMKFNYKNDVEINGVNFYYNDHKVDRDGSFHEWVSTFLVEGERVIELTARMLGKDDYGDRVFVSATYYNVSEDIYGSNYSHKDAVYYRYDKYKDITHKMIKLYQEYVNYDFDPKGIDAVRFKNGFNEFIENNKQIND